MTPEEIIGIYRAIDEKHRMYVKDPNPEFYKKLQEDFVEVLFERTKFAQESKVPINELNEQDLEKYLTEKNKICATIVRDYLGGPVYIEELNDSYTFGKKDEEIFLESKEVVAYNTVSKWGNMLNNIRNKRNGRSK